jgi:hypothetical protein
MANKFLSNIELYAGLIDSTISTGSSAQILSSTGSGVKWIDRPVESFTTVTKVSNTFAIDLSANNNFLLNASGTFYITLSNRSSNIGQTGTIIINNTGTTTAQPLPSYMLTPEGATLDWVNTSGAVSVISYIVFEEGKVLCNYVGNFQ